MKRIILPYVLALMACVGATAAPVTRNAALVSAQKFLSARGLDASSLTAAVTNRNLSPRQTGEETPDHSPYHIFNLGDGKGFIVIAGDDRAREILAYSDHGSIDPATMPESCRVWLAQYAGEISSLPAGQSAATDGVTAADNIYSTEVISPLLPCKWNQGVPYNYDCPIDPTTGQRCVTGCVATAVAQIMYYYRYPERGVGSVTYDDKGITRSIDFADYPAFDWDGMHDTYTSQTTEAEGAPVASLMKAVGYASKMGYSSKVSGAQHVNAGLALINNFGYDKNMHRYERSRMTDQEWYDIILTDLKAGHPVLYTGSNPEGAHAFVCDGYDGHGYYHINWGWGGLSDGYFSLSALTPPNQSTGGTDSGYSLGQHILVNIVPEGKSNLGPQTSGLMSLYCLYYRDKEDFHMASSTPVLTSDINDAQLFLYVFNRGMNEFSGEVCVADLTDGTIRPMMTQSVYFLGMDAYVGVRFPIAEIPGMSEGTHKVGFYYRTSESDQWHPVISSTISNPSTCTVTVSGDSVTFTSIYPDSKLRLVSAPVFTPLYNNHKTTWNFIVSNDGDTRFEGYTGIAFINAAGDYNTFCLTPTVCLAGETQDVEITNSLSTITSGAYKAVPFYTTNPEPTADNITPLADPVDVNIYSLVFMPTTGMNLILNGDPTSLALNVYNMGNLPWQASLEGVIIAPDGSSVPGRFYTDQISIEPGQSIPVSLKSDAIDLKRGTYTLNLYAAENRDVLLTGLPLIVVSDFSAIDEIKAGDIEVSVESDRISVSIPAQIQSCTLHDIAGRLQRRIDNIDTNVAAISTDGIASGVYILTVKPVDGSPIVKKISIRTY